MKPNGCTTLGHAFRALAVFACLTLGMAVDAPTRAEPAAPAFLPGMADVPLMRGLDVEQAETIVFDKPDGRIVATSAAGPVAGSDFVSYYSSALPELGWRAAPGGAEGAGELFYRREGETLRIEFADRGELLFARFLLSPG